MAGAVAGFALSSGASGAVGAVAAAAAAAAAAAGAATPSTSMRAPSVAISSFLCVSCEEPTRPAAKAKGKRVGQPGVMSTNRKRFCTQVCLRSLSSPPVCPTSLTRVTGDPRDDDDRRPHPYAPGPRPSRDSRAAGVAAAGRRVPFSRQNFPKSTHPLALGPSSTAHARPPAIAYVVLRRTLAPLQRVPSQRNRTVQNDVLAPFFP